MWSKPGPRSVSRFKSRYVESDKSNCWNWTGALFQKTRYGQFHYDNKTVLAHRFAYILKEPTFDQSLFVLHTCDNRQCVNPNHLYLGNHDKNMQDMVDRNRQARGTVNGESILEDVDVLTIFELSAKGHSQRAIGVMVGISQAEVWNVLHNRNWKHVKPISIGTEVAH